MPDLLRARPSMTHSFLFGMTASAAWLAWVALGTRRSDSVERIAMLSADRVTLITLLISCQVGLQPHILAVIPLLTAG
jgi:hypothetical protein